ncbi:MAG: dihydroorotase [Acidimicrobiales bacterium]
MLLIRGGVVLDQQGRRLADVLIDGAHIVAVGADVGAAVRAGPGPGRSDVTELDAGGAVVCAGFVDLHTHLRQPGMEEAETVQSGSRAAALGGYTAVVAMPNTDPCTDQIEIVEQVRAWGRDAALVAVHPAAAITIGRSGERLSDLAGLYRHGVRMFTDDGNEVADAAVMRAALQAAARLPGAVIAQHAECAALVSGGHLNEGPWSRELGLAGRPAVAEEITVARDLALVRALSIPDGGDGPDPGATPPGRVRYHVLHASLAATVALVAAARAAGLAVSVEVTPQHLTLTDACCSGGDPRYKVNPPLRGEGELMALRQALQDGLIDAIATDHAPHPASAKTGSFEAASPGMLGLETALGVILGPAAISLEAAIAALTWKPATIAGLTDQGRPIAPGEPANLCVFHPDQRWTVEPAALASKAKNTPFAGWELTGKVRHTVLAGSPTVIDGQTQR